MQLPLLSTLRRHSPWIRKHRRPISAALAALIVGISAIALTVGGAAPVRPSSIQGIYVMADVNTPIPQYVLASPAIDGVLLRYYWNELQPKHSRFDFATLDSEIARVKAAGKHYSLAILAGDFTPHWVYQNSGVAGLHMTVSLHQGVGKCKDITVPIPWNDYFLASYDTMIKALAAHIETQPGGLSGLTQVKATGINEYTEETRMPYQVPATPASCETNALVAWHQAGYTPALVEKSWNNIVDTWAAAFPGVSVGTAILSKSFPDIDASGAVVPGAGLALTDRLIVDGAAHYGARFSVQSNALGPNGGAFAPVLDARAKGATIGFQLTMGLFGNPLCPGVVTTKSLATSVCDPAALQRAMSLGISHGVAFLEVFPRTVAAYNPQLVIAHAAMS